ncbi:MULTISPECIES: RnfABCDGE type electron transport complex subunit B [unclassified Ectothiorhodospira]|uniref:RnfABCDGE type electron transport complex subunit B n=1 Tax=unclassified Ectothiorhodospira TaxID=2684909 RepID=UPI001EE913CD|nr:MULTISPECIES: RnfABCDGE type electron transport complex subunit B [unclassified Ectothiorhodospira]MCG5515031.1 RnfABCDGE type electron transport complex subunit B [Ectothiorhodospira sp. 9100]MCG5517646.1 RnfABCDGE type electron transport complex subunit B [Ectothiorhodospira sp. 9905]
MYAAIVVLTAMGLLLGYALGMAAKYLKVEKDPLVDEIEAMLPGTNCGQCGLPGCPSAAQALAAHEAPVTLCPPGGKALAQQLADKLSVSVDLSGMEEEAPVFARIKEDQCNGCTRCYKVCATDAIMGANRQIHTVFTEACNGCGKCVEVCPTNGLVLVPDPPTLRTWRWSKPEAR